MSGQARDTYGASADSGPQDGARDPAATSAPVGAGRTGSTALGALSGTGVASMSSTDVGVHKARSRSTRLQRLAVVLGIIAVLLVLRDLLDPGLGLPSISIPSSMTPYMLPLCLILLLTAVMVVPLLAAGRSPHILYRPDEMT